MVVEKNAKHVFYDCELMRRSLTESRKITELSVDRSTDDNTESLVGRVSAHGSRVRV